MTDEPEEALEVRYVLGDEDVEAYARHYLWSRPALFVGLAFSTITVMVFLAALYVLFAAPKTAGEWFPLGFALLPVVFVVPLLRYSALMRTLKTSVRSSGAQGEHRMTISAKGVLVVAQATGETLKYWKAIRKVTESASHVYLFVGLAQAFVLPKRAFASNEAMEAFLAKVKEYRALAAPPSPPSGTMSS